jgi:hypothetical protein
MERAIGEALHGFELLAAAGFWLDRPHAALLIRQLFKLRGAARLLPFFPDEKKIRQRLDGEKKTGAETTECGNFFPKPLPKRAAGGG